METIPRSERQLVWDTCQQLLQKYDLLQKSPQLRCFAWNMPYFINWHAVIHILDTLLAHPDHADAAKAWQLIGALYDNNAEMLLKTNRPVSTSGAKFCVLIHPTSQSYVLPS